MNDAIQRAEETVGRDEPKDWSIRPREFPELFRASAQAFSELLGRGQLRETAQRYEEADRKAIEAQARFRKLSNLATTGLFVAATAGALLVSFPAAGRWVTGALALVSFVGGMTALFTIQLASRERLLAGWMGARAGAETERLAYFQKLADLAIERHGEDPQMLLYCLELFRRYQVAVQRFYYRERGKQHAASMRKSSHLAVLSSAVLAVGAGGFGVWGLFDTGMIPLVGLSSIGTALAAAASRREELHQDGRNSERYQRTATALSKLSERHQDVQEGLAAGRPELLPQYVAAIHEQLSLEHRQWMDDSEALAVAARELEQSLGG